MTGYLDYEGFWVEDDPFPDPPYIGGDHIAQCRGCEGCAKAEAEYFEKRNKEKHNAII